MLNKPVSLLLPALLFGLWACDSETTPPTDATPEAAQLEGEVGCLGDCSAEDGHEHEHADAGAVATMTPVGIDGKGITLEEPTAISTILADPASFEGQRVLVRGEAVGVCSSRGCWVELKSDAEFQSIRVKVEDGEIVFPASCVGTVVTCEGIVQKLEFPVEKHREILASRAKAKGEEFDPDSVTQPLVIWQIKGLGALVEG